MTVDIRTAAQREAVERTIAPNIEDPLPVDHKTVGWRLGFVHGAEWAAKRVTPTREQIEEVIDEHAEVTDGINVYETADEILALMSGLAEGEHDGSDI